MPQHVQMLIITGMSGAGKSVAIEFLEDMGYFCVDNLPPALIPKFSELVRQSGGTVRRVALVCDLRGGEFFGALFDALKELDGHPELEYHILYLEADDETLVRRYKATRRKHPSAPDSGRIVDGIDRERRILGEVRDRSDMVINTSRLRPAELRELLENRFRQLANNPRFSVHVLSFGFKYGLPIDADLVFDVRFLPNPYYIDELKSHTGLDPEVYDYVMKWPTTEEFVQKWLALVDFLIPQYLNEGKPQVIVGIGCTGGRHRSVAIAERLRDHLQPDYPVTVVHRDVGKDVEP